MLLPSSAIEQISSVAVAESKAPVKTPKPEASTPAPAPAQTNTNVTPIPDPGKEETASTPPPQEIVPPTDNASSTPPVITPGMGNTAGNVFNSGYATQVGTNIYWNNGSGMYRYVNYSKYALITADYGLFLNSVDDWVYYCNHDDNMYLYKIKNDGNSKTRLNTDATYFATLSDGVIYYINHSDGDKLYRIDTDGNNRKVVCGEVVNTFNIVGDWIYYQNYDDTPSDNFIYKIRKDGSAKTLVASVVPYSIFIVDGSYIYYTNSYTNSTTGKAGHDLYRVKIDGTSPSKLYSGVVGTFNVNDGWIYFTDIASSTDSYGPIRKITTDGDQSTLKTLTSDPSGSLTLLTGSVLYYCKGSGMKSVAAG